MQRGRRFGSRCGQGQILRDRSRTSAHICEGMDRVPNSIAEGMGGLPRNLIDRGRDFGCVSRTQS